MILNLIKLILNNKMGAKASTEKHPNDGENDKFKFGSCSMQGWRQTNEDAMIS